MKIYEVDVRTLSPEEKRKTREWLGGLAFMVTEILDTSEGMVALRVYWDSKEDFFSFLDFSSNCPCKEIHL